MNRRRFVFGSLASAALFAPLLKGRRAAAAGEPPRRLFRSHLSLDTRSSTPQAENGPACEGSRAKGRWWRG